MSFDFKPYHAEKEQLLAEIDSLIHELEQLKQTIQKKNIAIVTDQLEKSLRQLSVLRQTKSMHSRTPTEK